ncbi:MAG: hypothetical protein R8N23_20725 [Reichenbachiella sp.]|uniref:hypothetical protein n=1 Tax=Reichenbachiella sp. TaxID=2184521 RepID=UPI00296744D0|nr:hypothetical protein [Reichenbachiella sp.]MDW3212307.1 hypothetical protein [Reichenbachiella sp.]
MADFPEHIKQAKNNLDFLSQVNDSGKKFWDWQVTISFYVAVHLVNAHIASKANMHYRSHNDVKNALNPERQVSLSKVDEETYKAFIKLQQLARRARYLCHDKAANQDEIAFFTYDKHFAKAIKNLDKIMSFIHKEYSEEFEPIQIDCIELVNYSSQYFKTGKKKIA